MGKTKKIKLRTFTNRKIMPSNESRIYVGNLPPDIRSKDIEDLFYKYGKIAFIDLKNRRGPPFAFVEFEDPRDADDAVYARDGYDYDGYKLRVEFPRGGGGSFRGRSGGSSRSGGRGPPARRSQYRVVVTGMTFFQKLFHLESLKSFYSRITAYG